MTTKILNSWASSKNDLSFIQVSNPILEDGYFRVFKQSEKIYLYTYKDISINQLVGLNEEYFKFLVCRMRPKNKALRFIYDRAMESIEKGENLLTFE